MPVPQLLPRLQTTTAHLRATGRPLVTLSYAQGIDGSLAQVRGTPLALSGPEARHFTHQLRAAHDAILIGIGTMLADDPRLTARGVDGDSPQPVILDTHLRTPPTARVFQHPRAPLIFCAPAAAAPLPRGEAIPVTLDPAGRLDLCAVLDQLARRGLASLMVEGGAAVITSFLAAGLADQVAITIAPVFVGGMRSVETSLESATRLTHLQTFPLGEDTLLTGAFG